jgi:hypothetical protein
MFFMAKIQASKAGEIDGSYSFDADKQQEGSVAN